MTSSNLGFSQITFDSIINICDATSKDEIEKIIRPTSDWKISEFKTDSTGIVKLLIGQNLDKVNKKASSWIYKSDKDGYLNFIYDALGTDYSGKKEFRKLLKQAKKRNDCKMIDSEKFVCGNYEIKFKRKVGNCNVGAPKIRLQSNSLTYKIFINRK